MTAVNYNLKTTDLFFDGQAIWRVTDTYPNNVRAQNLDEIIRHFPYEEVQGCLILESPEDYSKLDLRDISKKTAEWLSQRVDLSDYALQQVYNRVVQGWPSVDAYCYLAQNPAAPAHILWGLIEKSVDLAALVAGNPAIPSLMLNTLARHDSAIVRRSLARNQALHYHPDVVKRLSEDADKTVKIALDVAMAPAIED